jgi:hypothetical protein
MLQAAEDAQLEGEVRTGEEALKLVRERFPIRDKQGRQESTSPAQKDEP